MVQLTAVGSLLRLAQLLNDFLGPLRADFRREYGLDLDQVIADQSMRPSVMLDLIDNLTPNASLWKALNPPEPDDIWTPELQILAELTDRMGRLEAIQLAATTGRRRIEFPDPIERPGVTKDGADKLEADAFGSTDDFAEWYAMQPGGRPIAEAGRAPSTAGHPTSGPVMDSAGPDTSPPADPEAAAGSTAQQE